MILRIGKALRCSNQVLDEGGVMTKKFWIKFTMREESTKFSITFKMKRLFATRVLCGGIERKLHRPFPLSRR
jgi:hypothetical protein